VSSVRPENDIYISQARTRLAGFFETGGSHFLAFAGGTTSAMAAKPVKGYLLRTTNVLSAMAAGAIHAQGIVCKNPESCIAEPGIAGMGPAWKRQAKPVTR
jgi:hypothetical protein